MSELHWPPEAVGRLTLPQVRCLVEEEPPRAAATQRTAEEFEAALAARREADAAWSRINEVKPSSNLRNSSSRSTGTTGRSPRRWPAPRRG